jgi:hypothetical protein
MGGTPLPLLPILTEKLPVFGQSLTAPGQGSSFDASHSAKQQATT